MTTFPAPLPHGPIREIFPDVFVVRGSFRMAPLVSIARNMIILRRGTDLTLVNSVRLSAAGEAELTKLGAVKHLVKLGAFHTLDDPYYKSRFAPTFWAPAPQDAKTEKLVDGGPSPSEGVSVFSFERTKKGEAALVVAQPQGNLLVTCDRVQNWVDTEGCSLFGGLATRALGFIEPAKIGPMWLKAMTGGKPSALKPDFDRLLARDFVHLIAGHGDLLRDEARTALARSCEKTLRAG
ncbi:MAG: hypothetical protein QM820_36725 [Minicystis sp.]